MYFPRSGYRVTLVILPSMGYHMLEWRVRESVRRVDIERVLIRYLQLQIIHRRRYSVYGPLATRNMLIICRIEIRKYADDLQNRDL